MSKTCTELSYLLTRLRVEFRDLRCHSYNHNFHCYEQSWNWRKSNEHFLLHCPRFSTQRKTLLGLVSNLVGIDIMRLSSEELCTLLLYGNNDFSFRVNRGVIEETIKYI